MCTVCGMEPVTPRSWAQPTFHPNSDQWTQWGWPDQPASRICTGCHTSVHVHPAPDGGERFADHQHPERGQQCTGPRPELTPAR